MPYAHSDKSLPMMARMGYERTKGIGKRLQGALEPKGLKRESLGSIPTLGLGADPLPARCEQSAPTTGVSVDPWSTLRPTLDTCTMEWQRRAAEG